MTSKRRVIDGFWKGRLVLMMGWTLKGFGRSLLNLRNWHFAIIDVTVLLLTPVIALTLRLSPPWNATYLQNLMIYTIWSLAIKLLSLYLFGLYARYWQYASIDEAMTIFFATSLATFLSAGSFWGMQAIGWLEPYGLPRSIPLIDGLLTMLAIGGSRFSVRVVTYGQARYGRKTGMKRVLIAGAGDAGEIVVREILNSRRLNMQPVGFVDDDPKKIGTVIHGLRVLGPIDAIPRMVKEFNVGEVIIAIPSASGKVIRNIVTHCQAAQVASRTIPGLYEILSGSVKVAELRKVEIEDLLRREPVRIEMDEVAQMLTGKRVLVTGAGGSIGSELCRQMLRFKPAELTLLGHGENSLFDQEINLLKVRQRVGATETEIRVVISDVRDQQRINQVFQRYQPEILFHTAAHKHVPLMEENPEEAVTNNVWGTWVVVNEALRVGVERFAFISTDKAVNPVNIMGMTKRVGELIVHQVAKESGRPYVVVRFGNVLGSRGSVVSVFQEQIAEGGPVTITHPEATRFFMTIPEAVQLVLQAATMGKGGEVFVLDMGEPVKIVDLVRDMIELSGYEVGVDMDIVYTGLRPGDKLSEELFTHSEQAGHTSHEKIWVAEGGKWLAEDSFIERVTELIELSKAGDQTQIRQKLSDLITRFEN